MQVKKPQKKKAQKKITPVSSSRSAIKPYVCVHPGCTSSFSKDYDLGRHMKIRHMKIHLPLARFDCPYAGSSTCGRTGEKTATSKGGFTREDYYLAHLKRVHGVDGRRRLEGGTETIEKITVKRAKESGQGDTVVDSVNDTQHQHSQRRASPAFPNHGSSQDPDSSPFPPQDTPTSQNPYPNSDTIIRKTPPLKSSDSISTVPEFSCEITSPADEGKD